MAVTINDLTPDEGSTRDRVSRTLSVAGAIYGLLALLTGGLATAGLFGLFGLAADPASVGPARLLAMPWSLAAGPAETATPVALLVIVGGLAVNLLVLFVGSRLARGRVKG